MQPWRTQSGLRSNSRLLIGGGLIARQLEGRTDPEAEVIRGYGGAVRSALTDDGHPPLVAAGLKLHDRLVAIAESLERVEKRGPCPNPLRG